MLLLAWTSAAVWGREYHVAPDGNDQYSGSMLRPFKTISAAAVMALPGDEVVVHAGTYRERVNPPRGGTSDAKRIVYRAAKGEVAIIKGSEIIREWSRFAPGVWKATIPNTFFGAYNPYLDLITGDWFDNKKRPHHTGEVYLNGKSLYEMPTLEAVRDPQPIAGAFDAEGSTYTWYCESDGVNTTIYANFHGYDPTKELVEINVRESCFYPDQPGCNYLTVRGFRMCQAATQWAAPTAEQIGLIGTHWSKGWIIENNVISDSKCSGITLGKDRKSGHNVWSNDRSKGGDIHYNEVIVRVLEDGWSKAKIGSHLVRDNTIFNCEQTGICGSLGAAFSQIQHNYIYNIWTKRMFAGAEIAGIKIHASIDMVIRNNHLRNVGRGMWMDWMAQGTRITGNLCYQNTTDDLYIEVNHGPYLVDNNIFLSPIALHDMSQGGAYAHNLLAGKINRRPDKRRTPYHQAHSTALAGLTNLLGGDNRFFNNLLVATNQVALSGETEGKDGRLIGFGLGLYRQAPLPVLADGNVYYNGGLPLATENNVVIMPSFDPQITIQPAGEHAHLTISLERLALDMPTASVTTKRLGKAVIPGLGFENPDGSPLKIDTDYFGKKRNPAHPAVGPFENLGPGRQVFQLW